jgi:uncharacterized protein YjiK
MRALLKIGIGLLLLSFLLIGVTYSMLKAYGTTSPTSVAGRTLSGETRKVDAMAVTVDGGTLFALTHAGGRIVRLDVGSGTIVGEVPGGGFDRLAAVVPW